MRKLLAFTTLVLVLTACSPTPSPVGGLVTQIVITAAVSTVIPETPAPPPTEGPSPTPVPPTPIPTLPSSSISVTELKYRVLGQYPNFFYCDPDFYPVPRDNELMLAKERFAELQNNEEVIQSILSHNNLSNNTFFTDQQKLLIYREYKKLNAISFQRVENAYQFQIQTGTEGQQGSLITGTIDANGVIEVQNQEPAFPTCPICLAQGTLIDTPRGAVAVEALQAGDPVWTMNAAGERVAGTIVRLGSTKVPATHEVIHILLRDGRELFASPGHPTADGRTIGDLQAGDFLDGAPVMLVKRLPYRGEATFDLLPSGETGHYWANGILLNSTLTEP